MSLFRAGGGMRQIKEAEMSNRLSVTRTLTTMMIVAWVVPAIGQAPAPRSEARGAGAAGGGGRAGAHARALTGTRERSRGTGRSEDVDPAAYALGPSGPAGFMEQRNTNTAGTAG